MTVYYVSPTGSDTQAGTVGQPFGSLQHAHDIAQPGDEIQLRGGTYRLTRGVQLTRDGTSTQPITIRNYPGEVPVLDGSGVSATGAAGYVLDLSGVAYNRISGLQITNGAEGGVMIRNNSHDNVIQGLDVSRNGRLSEWEGKGFSLFDTSYNNQLLNNDSHDNRDLHGDNADGFQISTTGTGNVLRGNRAYNNSDDGFDLFNVQNGTASAPVTLDGNWAWGNGTINGQRTGGDGNGFKLGGQRPGTGTSSGGHIVTNNVAWDNVASGFDENQATAPSTLRNNTAYDNGAYNFGFYSQANTLDNNLSLGTGQVASSGTNHNNSWNLASPPATSAVQSLNASVAQGPRAADGSLPASGFLVLNGSTNLSLGAAAVSVSGSATTQPTTGTSSGTSTTTPVTAAPTTTIPVTAAPTTTTPVTTNPATSTPSITTPVASTPATTIPVTAPPAASAPATGTATGGSSTNLVTGGSSGGGTVTDPATPVTAAPGLGVAPTVDPVHLVTGDPSGQTGTTPATGTDIVRGHRGGGRRGGRSNWAAIADACSHRTVMGQGGTAPTDPLHLLIGGTDSSQLAFADAKIG